jgi:hypothetical protein
MKDHKDQAPIPSDEQESPEPERPVNPQEADGQSIDQLEDPPQAEGSREDADE